ncbi:MAG: long-chain fatty acid--CoA ligase [Bacteroidales bacterium]|jgi:long-chain acyl-CoA synthetase|nr:long-chain fatty acid--CoA ligase [Bacteroidales bacterium]
MEEITRIFDILDLYNSKYSELEDAIVYKNKTTKEWTKLSAKNYYQFSHLLACGFISKGFQKGDKVVTISPSIAHWNITDMALSMSGLIHVPVYTTLGTDEMEKILDHCDAKAIFVADESLYKKIKPIIEKISHFEHIFSFYYIEGLESMQEIIKKAAKNENELMEKLIPIKKSICEDDIYTIIYTSGTTGDPKGVMLSHKNILSNARPLLEPLPTGYKDHALSFLPLCHVYERMLNYAFQWLGSSIYYAENLGTILQDIQYSKPVIFNSVPRVLEKFYDNIIAKGKDLKRIKRIVFFWAVRLGYNFNEVNHNSAWYNFRLKIARKLVFSQWVAAFGGNIKIIVSGGSALQIRLAKLYSAAGLEICEGYGLSETSPVISVNLPGWDAKKLGTIGQVLKGVKVKIANDGEILTSGDCVMKGYYKNSQLTAEVIDTEGWFHTGDIGLLDEDQFLKITDRKKEFFKTSSGKFIAPQIIENKFKSSPLIEQIMIVGENEKFASALISPNFIYLHFYAAKHKVHFRNNAELIQNELVIKKFQKEINELNKTLAEHEKIKRFQLVSDEWTQPTGELSQTLKLKRRFILNKYNSILEKIYGHGKNDDRLVDVNIKELIKDELTSEMKEIKNKISENINAQKE